MWMLFFLLSALAFGSVSNPKWETATTDLPRAVFFDAGREALLVSLDDGKGHAHVDQYGLDGKLQKQSLVEAKGEAGALRAYGEKIFWLVDGKLVDEKGRPVPTSFPAVDITVARGGKPVVAGAEGVTGAPDLKGATGIYQKNDRIYVLYKQDQLLEIGSHASRAICGGPCRWLEVDSKGAWITVQGASLYRADKKFLELPSKPGRPAYVFRLVTREDTVVLPFPEEKKLRSYAAELP